MPEGPSPLLAKISGGLEAEGNVRVVKARMVKNNDESPWQFIAGKLAGPGVDGTILVWATGSLDLDETALLVATDSVTEAFSIWNIPRAGRFAPKFDDDIQLANQCVSG